MWGDVGRGGEKRDTVTLIKLIVVRLGGASCITILYFRTINGTLESVTGHLGRQVFYGLPSEV